MKQLIRIINLTGLGLGTHPFLHPPLFELRTSCSNNPNPVNIIKVTCDTLTCVGCQHCLHSSQRRLTCPPCTVCNGDGTCSREGNTRPTISSTLPCASSPPSTPSRITSTGTGIPPPQLSPTHSSTLSSITPPTPPSASSIILSSPHDRQTTEYPLQVDQTFQTIDEATSYIQSHVRQLGGFETRFRSSEKLKNSQVIKKLSLVCSRENYSNTNKSKDGEQRQRKGTTCDCPWSLNLNYQKRSNVYKVTKFIAEHRGHGTGPQDHILAKRTGGKLMQFSLQIWYEIYRLIKARVTCQALRERISPYISENCTINAMYITNLRVKAKQIAAEHQFDQKNKNEIEHERQDMDESLNIERIDGLSPAEVEAREIMKEILNESGAGWKCSKLLERLKAIDPTFAYEIYYEDGKPTAII
eukprot:Awhi_evm1s8521